MITAAEARQLTEEKPNQTSALTVALKNVQKAASLGCFSTIVNCDFSQQELEDLNYLGYTVCCSYEPEPGDDCLCYKISWK